jgi:hypothetical protein
VGTRQELMQDVAWVVRQVFANQPQVLAAFDETLRLADRAGIDAAPIVNHSACSFEEWVDK